VPLEEPVALRCTLHITALPLQISLLPAATVGTLLLQALTATEYSTASALQLRVQMAIGALGRHHQ
jgi:hypothetical protein